MGTLEQVMQMRGQGMDDNQIVSTLQKSGIPPLEIQNSINQANIKNAVAGAPQGEMQTSIVDNQETPQGDFPPQQEYSSQEQMQQEYAPSQEAMVPQEEYYPQEGYSSYGSGGNYDSQTLVEIAEQSFAERIKPVEKQLSKLNEFMNLSKIKIDSMEERLKRMEKYFDTLQLEILEKIGSYGNNLSSIKDEMSMMQDSFSKIVRSKK
jgi:hypothetical protein